MGGEAVTPRVWYVVRVNRDPSDTYAAKSFRAALDLAAPDRGARLEYGIVVADDCGWARIAVRRWHPTRVAAYASAGMVQP